MHLKKVAASVLSFTLLTSMAGCSFFSSDSSEEEEDIAIVETEVTEEEAKEKLEQYLSDNFEDEYELSDITKYDTGEAKYHNYTAEASRYDEADGMISFMVYYYYNTDTCKDNFLDSIYLVQVSDEFQSYFPESVEVSTITGTNAELKPSMTFDEYKEAAQFRVVVSGDLYTKADSDDVVEGIKKAFDNGAAMVDLTVTNDDKTFTQIVTSDMDFTAEKINNKLFSE
jgi:hypothetical protein